MAHGVEYLHSKCKVWVHNPIATKKNKVVEGLSSKPEALSSNPSITKKKVFPNIQAFSKCSAPLEVSVHAHVIKISCKDRKISLETAMCKSSQSNLSLLHNVLIMAPGRYNSLTIKFTLYEHHLSPQVWKHSGQHRKSTSQKKSLWFAFF
jgi:hypothetical protein